MEAVNSLVFGASSQSSVFFFQMHPFEALQQYRETMNLPDAKFILVAMNAKEHLMANPLDGHMLDICGLDAKVPRLIEDFIKGEF